MRKTALVAAASTPAARSPALVLTALVLLYVTNQWARMLPSFLVSFDAAGQAGKSGRELMNLALNFDATQYGLLVSYGFTLLYVACSFPAGMACDLYSRKAILLLAATGWSAATALSAVARNYAQLLGARVLLGITQAFSGPASHTLISATFPPRRRATVNAIYTGGSTSAARSHRPRCRSVRHWRQRRQGRLGGPPAALLAARCASRQDPQASTPQPRRRPRLRERHPPTSSWQS